MTPTDVSDRPKEGEVGVQKEVKYCHGTWGASFSKNVLGNVDCSRPESGHGKFADLPPFLCYSKLSVCVLSGIWDRLLIDPKRNCRKNSTLQTVRIERSPCKYLSLSFSTPLLSQEPPRMLNFAQLSSRDPQSRDPVWPERFIVPPGLLRGLSVLGAADSVFHLWSSV